MSWDQTRSLERIRRFKSNVPESAISVEDFAREYLPRRVELARTKALVEGEAAVVAIPRNRAILTDGVHIYAELMDFAQQLTAERETEASYRRALQFLHLHYGACDRLIEVFGLQRVDFHGARLHAVVLTPTGEDGERERIGKALAFAQALQEMMARAGQRFGGRFATRVSIGIDTGKAIAINSGRGDEHEPLFIGRPANHAAHLAADGPAGVHLSERVRGRLALAGRSHLERALALEQTRQLGFGARAPGGGLQRSISEALTLELASYENELKASELEGQPASFVFHHHTPPLRTIAFKDHPPSNAILMPMAAIFADLDGFTNYVDRSLASGDVRQLVANLHVLRGEFAATLRDDFNGRKVRFIGDCLQGVLAEGDARQVDTQISVETAVLAAGGLRSSFDLCRQELAGIEGLGLAIGVELGATPACRIGLRGEDSVRCVTSTATCASELLQQDCNGAETHLGEAAFAAGGFAVQQAFRASRKLRNLNYAAAATLVRGLSPPTTRSHSSPVRAHAQ